MNLKMAARLALVAILFSTPVLAGASCDLEGLSFSDADQSRLTNLGNSRQKGLVAALRVPSQNDRESLADLFAASHRLLPLAQLEGTYKCRTFKLGGALSLVIYDWFSCRITSEAGLLHLQKTTGSQNFTGTLTPSGDFFTYRGAQHYGYEGAGRLYGQDVVRDQVGCLSVLADGPGHLMLELPQPLVESDHDVIELLRQAK